VEISYLVSQCLGNFRTSRNNQRCPPQRNHGKVEHLPNCWLKAHVKCLCSDGNFGKDLSLEHCEVRISDTERWRTWLYIEYIYIYISILYPLVLNGLLWIFVLLAGDELNDVMSAAVMQKLGRQLMVPMEDEVLHLGCIKSCEYWDQR